MLKALTVVRALVAALRFLKVLKSLEMLRFLASTCGNDHLDRLAKNTGVFEWFSKKDHVEHVERLAKLTKFFDWFAPGRERH